MRKTVVALALICVAAYTLAQDSALKVGSIVAALWDDGSWYRGTVTAIKSGTYTVDYDDGDSSTLQRSEIKLISANPKVAKGQKVFALWEEDGIFYLGTVSEVRKTDIAIVWDDGGQSASIPFGMFTTDVAAASSTTKSFALWHKGSRVGEVEPTGRIWIGGSAVGQIEPDGRVWKDGAQVGEVEPNGRVWKNGAQVGEIESNGRVWKDGSIIGEAPGLKIPWTAAIYYFFFINE
jgi:hypothetical protein